MFQVMAHLRRGLAATGLTDDDATFNNNNARRSTSFGRSPSTGGHGSPNSSFSRKASLARSFTKRGRSENAKEEAVRSEAKRLERQRGALARVATSNSLHRDAIERANSAEVASRSFTRKSAVSAATGCLISTVLGGSPGSFKRKEMSRGAGRRMGASSWDDELAC